MLKIIGLGSYFRGDDAVGLRIIEELRKRELPPFVMLIEAGADAFTVLQHLIEKEPVLLIDCAEMDKEPGSFIKFDVKSAVLKEKLNTVSLHGFSFADVYSMAQKMGEPASCSIIGIQPRSLKFNTALSEEVEKSIPLILEAVEKEIMKCH